MCVSFNISILAGVIGEICAVILFHIGEKENATLIAVYSLIQFYEAHAYAIKTTPILPIQILLAAQGVAFFAVSHSINKSRASLVGLIATICIFLTSILYKEKYATNCTQGCRWEIGPIMYAILIVMYTCILQYGLSQPHMTSFHVFVLLSLIIAMFKKDKLHLSWWCFVSAITTPLYVAWQFSQFQNK